jgi:hypothetical protein
MERLHKRLRARLSARNRTLAGSFEHPDQLRDRKPNHVPEISLDRFDQRGASPLDRVTAGPAVPFTSGQVCVDFNRFESPETDLRHGDVGLLAALVAQADAAVDLVCTTRQALQERMRLVLVARLAEDAPVEDDLCVAAQDDVALDRTGLAASVLEHDVARVPLRQLLDLGGLDREVDAELLEDRAPLGRRRGKD